MLHINGQIVSRLLYQISNKGNEYQLSIFADSVALLTLILNKTLSPSLKDLGSEIYWMF